MKCTKHFIKAALPSGTEGHTAPYILGGIFIFRPSLLDNPQQLLSSFLIQDDSLSTRSSDCFFATIQCAALKTFSLIFPNLDSSRTLQPVGANMTSKNVVFKKICKDKSVSEEHHFLC